MVMHIKREQFIWNFYKNSKTIIPGCYEYVRFNNQKILNSNASSATTLPNVIYVSLFPTFLKSKLVNEEHYKSKSITHFGFSGVGITLNESQTAESYLNSYTSRQLRVKLKKAIKKLENDRNINYELNFGDISDEKCEFLLNTLYTMTNKRFDNKKENHVFMMEWESNTKDLAALIRQNKSSLLVIYDGKKPISISVKRHISNTILFSETHAYDSDYSKYSLSDLDKYYTVNWCINNNYPFIDLGIGLSYHKKKWANLIYDIEYKIYYKNNAIARGIAQFEITKIKLKNTLKQQIEYIKNIKSKK